MLYLIDSRLRACRDLLKWDEIATRVVNVSSIVAGEFHENEVRKDFTASERVAIGKTIEAEIGKRQGQRTDLEPVDDGPQVKGQKTREIAAGKAGFASDRSYRDAAKVVDQGAPELVAAMDAGIV